ncbi:MAG: ribonuclease P protein subunit [Candidatus Micrarchaeota archaeon]|nr:ribonuclease P protein subunit [Candidatus Micrarchaeota archaeon]
MKKITDGDTACMREFTGKRVKVLFSTDSKLVGKEYLVVKETKNSLVVLDDRRHTRRLIKESNIIQFDFQDNLGIVDGRKILFSPEQRTKRYLR